MLSVRALCTLIREGSQCKCSPVGPLVRRVLAVNGGAGGDLRLGVDGFRLCADLSCRMARISNQQH